MAILLYERITHMPELVKFTIQLPQGTYNYLRSTCGPRNISKTLEGLVELSRHDDLSIRTVLSRLDSLARQVDNLQTQKEI